MFISVLSIYDEKTVVLVVNGAPLAILTQVIVSTIEASEQESPHFLLAVITGNVRMHET